MAFIVCRPQQNADAFPYIILLIFGNIIRALDHYLPLSFSKFFELGQQSYSMPKNPRNMPRMDGLDLENPGLTEQLARERSLIVLDKRARPRFAVQFIKLRDFLVSIPFLRTMIDRLDEPERPILAAAEADIGQSDAQSVTPPTSRLGLADYVPEHRKAKQRD